MQEGYHRGARGGGTGRAAPGRTGSGAPENLEVQLLEVGRIDRRGGVVHQRGRARGFRERGRVADRVAAVEEDDETVEAERDAAVRRGAVLERLEQEAEFLLRLLRGHADHLHDLLLDVLPVDSNAPARQLLPVRGQVVELRVYAPRIGRQVRQVLVERHREDVM